MAKFEKEVEERGIVCGLMCKEESIGTDPPKFLEEFSDVMPPNSPHGLPPERYQTF